MATFHGKTENAPFLSASFWQKGTKIVARVLRSFHTDNGTAYALKLHSPVKLNCKEVSLVALGGLKGFEMALVSAAGLDRLRPGDDLYLECVGKTASTKGAERIDFELEVNRSDSPSAEITDDDVPF
jgi:hypothetical protein